MTAIEEAREARDEARNHVEHFALSEGDAIRVTRLADVIDALIAEVERLSVPPTDDEREALASRWLANYHGSIDATALTLAFKAGYSAGFRREGPITDEAVEAAEWAIAKERFRRAGISVLRVDRADADLCEADARAALEAAERVRSAAPSTIEPNGSNGRNERDRD